MRNAKRQMDCTTSCMCSCKHETDKQRHLNIMAGESHESLLQESISLSSPSQRAAFFFLSELNLEQEKLKTKSPGI